MDNNSDILNKDLFPRDLGDCVEIISGVILPKAEVQSTQKDIDRFNREHEKSKIGDKIYPRAFFGFYRW